LRTGLTSSRSEATLSAVDSANQEETICTPIGRPSWLVPNRIDRAGMPVRLAFGTAILDIGSPIAIVKPE
jgi:hypothetical protein